LGEAVAGEQWLGRLAGNTRLLLRFGRAWWASARWPVRTGRPGFLQGGLR